MPKEIWKDIPGYESYYQVSNKGRVKSLPRNGTIKTSKILTPIIMRKERSSTTYRAVILCKNGKHKHLYVHRLVALAFIENTRNKAQINHIDGDGSNNMVNNLEWVNQSENIKHAYKNDLIPSGDDCSFSKLTEEEVGLIRKKYKPYKYTQKRLAKEYGVSKSCIQAVLEKRSWK